VDVIVSDRGPGIPKKDRERVLQRFVRLQPSRSIPGSGLGLSLVAAVTRLHDGSVTLEDNNPGLRIRLTLKKNLPAPEAVKPLEAAGLLSHAS
jgi:signal transduction histidine kinase